MKKNQDYYGPYPDKRYYGYNTFTKKNKEEFDKWCSTPKENKFNFQKEMFEYCFADVELLLRGCIVLKQSFLNLELDKELIGEDPFQYITIAHYVQKFIDI